MYKIDEVKQRYERQLKMITGEIKTMESDLSSLYELQKELTNILEFLNTESEV